MPNQKLIELQLHYELETETSGVLTVNARQLLEHCAHSTKARA